MNPEKLTGRGGAGRGQGRKEGKTKSSRTVSLDNDLWKWIDSLGGKYSAQLNKITKAHRNRILDIIREVDELQDRFI